MSTKRSECCWCGEILNPKVRHYWGRNGRGEEKVCTNYQYPDLCPKCSKNKNVRKRFDAITMQV